MCDEVPAGDVALGEIGGAIEGLVGFALKNAIPCAIAVVADITLVFTIHHLVLILVSTAVALVGGTLAGRYLSRWLLRIMGTVAVPVGLDRLTAPKQRPVRRIALEARPAIAIPVRIRPGLPGVVANPEAVMIAATTEALEIEPASVTINGARFPVLGKREGR